jgi:ubiquinone biosynthesis protein COQ9
MAIMSFSPNNALESIQNLLELSSEMWYIAGDKSVDVGCRRANIYVENT